MSELRAYFERWQRLEERRQALGDDLKELFAEAKGNGFAPKAMRIAFRSIVAAENESDGDRETAAQVELYVNEITRPRAHPAPAYTREITEQPETANEVPAQDSGGTATGESPSGKSNAARPASVDAHVNDGGLAGEVSNEVVTGGESAATNPVAKAGEDANHTMLAATTDPASRGEDVEDRQPLASPGFAGEREPASGEPVSAEQEPAPHSQPLRKTAADYRTHCLRPDACGSSSLDHCFTCKQAMAEQRVSA